MELKTAKLAVLSLYIHSWNSPV